MTQKDQVYKHLKEHKSITSGDAIMEYGITSLSDIIYRLRNENVRIASKEKIVTTRLKRKTSIAEYTLLEDERLHQAT